MSKKEFNSENLKKVSGGLCWEIPCERCGKIMLDGIGVIRLEVPETPHPYFCTKCGEELLNRGEATIEEGYEKHYEKYVKKIVDHYPIYGWRRVED